MGRHKIDPIIEGEVRGFLAAGWSESVIIKYMKKKNIKIGKGTIYNIKNRDKLSSKTNQNRRPKEMRFRKLDKKKMKKLKKMAADPNPKPQRIMGSILGCSQVNISYHINKSLNLKLKKKTEVHRLSELNIKNRRLRSLKLYNKLCSQRYKKVITTDEAWFYVNEFDGVRKTHYISRNKSSLQKAQKICRKERFSKGVMVWAGISAKGKTSLHFVIPGAKIDSKYYINNVLKKFLRRDVPKLYPDGNFIFHQDSAPSHQSKETQEFLKNQNINYITPGEWIPKSPDAAPMDYFVWGYLKNQLRKKNIKDTAALIRALKKAWKELPQEMIDRALASWPRRVYNIYKAQGGHIE